MVKKVFGNAGRFVRDRYGFDARNHFALKCSVITVVLASILPEGLLSSLCYGISTVSLLYVYYLMLSKDISARSAEMAHLVSFCCKMKRRYQVIKRCWMVWRKRGCLVNSRCGQHVCLLNRPEYAGNSGLPIKAGLSPMQRA